MDDNFIFVGVMVIGASIGATIGYFVAGQIASIFGGILGTAITSIIMAERLSR